MRCDGMGDEEAQVEVNGLLLTYRLELLGSCIVSGVSYTQVHPLRWVKGVALKIVSLAL